MPDIENIETMLYYVVLILYTVIIEFRLDEA